MLTPTPRACSRRHRLVGTTAGRRPDRRVPVVHILHDAGVGTPYDVTAKIGQIVDHVAPIDGEDAIGD
ncbi:hypothetical protein [Gordonia hydrophobica]|uniref:Uncharacterized protein n=1 Tax=Gordonia hydrophobica TaxID=40516 RepID=A0ABZ2TYE0_9ACTN|nr:hypothetical protein [Gordonia hydrophobica]MBM7367046.1 hypothetical protein [Gordonia hydrophobica]